MDVDRDIRLDEERVQLGRAAKQLVKGFLIDYRLLLIDDQQHR